MRLSDYYNKVKNILFSPSLFFSNLKKEKGIESALKYFIVLFLFYLIFAFLFYSLVFSVLGAFGFWGKITNLLSIAGYGFLLFFFLIIIGIVFGIGATFIQGFILFVWLYVFKGRLGYSKAYQLFIYSMTPTFVFGWIPIVNFLIGFYNLVLLIVGTKRLYNFSTLKSILMYVILLVLVLILYFWFVFSSFKSPV